MTGLDQALCFPGLVSPTTMFLGIRSLRSGHCLIVNQDGVVEKEYWDLIYPEAGQTERMPDDFYIEGLRHLIEQSVLRRLQADTRIGVYLSGGLDSSVIAAVISRYASERQKYSFSVSFKDRKMSEENHQRSMASLLGTEHHEVRFDTPDIARLLRTTIYHTECPLKETYNTACLALSEAARKNQVPVVLTGQGADELFAGYIGYRFDSFYQAQSKRLTTEEETERQIRRQLWGDPDIVYDGNYAGLSRLKKELYSEAANERLEEWDSFQSLQINPTRLRGRHVIHQRSYLDHKLRLSDHLLSDHGDRMAMAHGVEARAPILGHRSCAIRNAGAPRIKTERPRREVHFEKGVAVLDRSRDYQP